MKIWFDGKLQEASDTGISGMVHALHYGTGVFEGIRSYAGTQGTYLFRLKDHIDRLFESAKALRLSIPFSRSEIETAIQCLLDANHLTDAYIRPLVFVGQGSMSLDIASPSARNSIHTLIAAWEWKSYFRDGPIAGLRVQVGPWKRSFQSDGLSKVKASGFYVNAYLAHAEAKEAEYDEAILVDENHNLAEASAANIFIVKGTTLLTPGTRAALPGITRSTIMDIARDIGVGVEVRDIPIEEFRRADHAFLTGTACEVAPIASINGQPFGTAAGARTTSELAGLYRRAVRNEYLPAMHGTRSEWCSPVVYGAKEFGQHQHVVLSG